MERYFKLQGEDAGHGLIDFKFVPNQVYYDEEVFSHVRSIDEPIEVACVKDRKARWTTWEIGVASAYAFTTPGFHVLIITDSEDTFKPINRMIDLFYYNMPLDVRPKIKDGHWGVEFKEIAFEDKSELGSSSITLSSSRSPNFGRGETPKMVIYDEWGMFNENFSREMQTSLRNSLPPSTWFFKGGTPNGPRGAMYEEVQAFKKGEKQLTAYLFRSWWDNPANVLPPYHVRRRPKDMADPLIPGSAGGQVGEDMETAILERFPDDGIDPSWRLAWRRSKIAESLISASNDARVAFALFLQEHAEDDESCWVNIENPQVDERVLRQQLAEAGSRHALEDTLLDGLRFRAYIKPVPSHIYTAGMDFSSGHSNDYSCLQIWDATAKMFVAELYGKTSPLEACKVGVQIAERYNWALFAPEYTGQEGIGEFAMRDLGYPNVYRRERRPGEKVTDRAYTSRPWGWSTYGSASQTRASSKGMMISQFKMKFNSGSVYIMCEDFLRDIQSYDPDSQRDHLPDRLVAGMIALEVEEQSQRRALSTGTSLLHGRRKSVRIRHPRSNYPALIR